MLGWLSRFDRLFPTCDNAQSPSLKAAIHGATAGFYLLMVVYHGKAVAFHVRGWLRG